MELCCLERLTVESVPSIVPLQQTYGRRVNIIVNRYVYLVGEGCVMAPLFTDTEDDILLEEVANHPSLWQLSHPQYKDQRMKDNIWTLISDKVGKPSKLFF